MESLEIVQPFLPLIVVLLCACITLPITLAWIHWKTKKEEKQGKKQTSAPTSATTSTSISSPPPIAMPAAVPDDSPPILSGTQGLFETVQGGGYLYRRIAVVFEGAAAPDFTSVLERCGKYRVIRVQGPEEARRLSAELSNLNRPWDNGLLVLPPVGLAPDHLSLFAGKNAVYGTKFPFFVFVQNVPSVSEATKSITIAEPNGCEVVVASGKIDVIAALTAAIREGHRKPSAPKNSGVVGAAPPSRVLPSSPEVSPYFCGHLTAENLVDHLRKKGLATARELDVVHGRCNPGDMDFIHGLRPLSADALAWDLGNVMAPHEELVKRVVTQLKGGPNVVVVSGPPACGKSTFGRVIAWHPEILTHFKFIAMVSNKDVLLGQESVVSVCTGVHLLRLFTVNEGSSMSAKYFAAMAGAILIIIDDVDSAEALHSALKNFGLGTVERCGAPVLVLSSARIPEDLPLTGHALKARLSHYSQWPEDMEYSWENVLQVGYDCLSREDRAALAAFLHAAVPDVDLNALSTLIGGSEAGAAARFHRLRKAGWLRVGIRSSSVVQQTIVAEMQPEVREWLRTNPGIVRVDGAEIHRRMFQDYHGKCMSKQWASKDDSYMYRGLLTHIAQHSGLQVMRTILGNGHWINRMFQRGGTDTVHRVITTLGTGDPVLDEAVKETVSAPFAHAMKEEFRTQLCLRLPRTHPAVVTLSTDAVPLRPEYAKAGGRVGTVWHRPLHNVRPLDSNLLPGEPAPVSSLFVLGGTPRPLLISGHEDGRMFLWDCEKGTILRVLPKVHGMAVDVIVQSGTDMASGCRVEHSIYVWTFDGVDNFTHKKVPVLPKPSNEPDPIPTPELQVTISHGEVDFIRIRHPREGEQYNTMSVAVTNYVGKCVTTVTPGFPVSVVKAVVVEGRHVLAFGNSFGTVVFLEGMVTY